MIKKSTLWAVVLLLLLSQAFAIGIRPAKTEIVSEESPRFSGTIWVVNEEQREFEVKIYASGDLAQYITLKNTELKFLPTDGFKGIDFEVNLPAIIPPGSSTSYIIVEESLPIESTNVITSKLLLKHKIIIQGEYPDKYIEVKVNFHENPETIAMVSEIENKGKLPLNSVKTTFKVNDKEQNQLSIETQQTELNTKETKLLTAELGKENFVDGEYTVSALTAYDDLEIELIKELRIGKPEVDITYFNEYFIAKKVNEYSLDLLNKWNKQIKQVFVDIEVKKDSDKLDEFRTKSIDIEGEATQRITDYFDARDKETGQYDFDMTVNFWNNYRMETKTFKSELLSESEYSQRSPQPQSSSFFPISITIIFILIIASLFLYKHYIRKSS